MTRDPKRIPGFLAALKAKWEQYPDLRFGQLVRNVVGNHWDSFYIEDEHFLRRLFSYPQDPDGNPGEVTPAIQPLNEQAVRDAAAPLVAFIDAWEQQPMLGIDDEFYSIHTGTPYAASLRRSDLIKLRAALKGGRSSS